MTREKSEVRDGSMDPSMRAGSVETRSPSAPYVGNTGRRTKPSSLSKASTAAADDESLAVVATRLDYTEKNATSRQFCRTN